MNKLLELRASTASYRSKAASLKRKLFRSSHGNSDACNPMLVPRTFQQEDGGDPLCVHIPLTSKRSRNPHFRSRLREALSSSKAFLLRKAQNESSLHCGEQGSPMSFNEEGYRIKESRHNKFAYLGFNSSIEDFPIRTTPLGNLHDENALTTASNNLSSNEADRLISSDVECGEQCEEIPRIDSNARDWYPSEDHEERNDENSTPTNAKTFDNTTMGQYSESPGRNRDFPNQLKITTSENTEIFDDPAVVYKQSPLNTTLHQTESDFVLGTHCPTLSQTLVSYIISQKPSVPIEHARVHSYQHWRRAGSESPGGASLSAFGRYDSLYSPPATWPHQRYSRVGSFQRNHCFHGTVHNLKMAQINRVKRTPEYALYKKLSEKRVHEEAIVTPRIQDYCEESVGEFTDRTNAWLTTIQGKLKGYYLLHLLKSNHRQVEEPLPAGTVRFGAPIAH